MSTAPRTSSSWAGRHDETEYDALTELFLGGTPLREPGNDDQVDAVPEAPFARCVIEVLVMGHLPFRAGPWAAQYARAIAKTEQCVVGLVRVHHDQTTIDLFAHSPELLADLDSVDGDLPVALTRIGASVDRWILHADDAQEPLLAGELDVDAVTLLSGTNEAARVDAYKTLKQLITGAPGVVLRRQPQFRIAMIGADDDRAVNVATMIANTVQKFLGCRLAIAPPVGKMGATGGVTTYRGAGDLDVRALVAMLVRLEPQALTVVETPAAPIEETLEFPELPVMEEEYEFEPQPIVESVVTAPDVAVTTPVAATPPTIAPAKVEAPVVEAEPTSQVIDAPLWSYITGVMSMEARSPDDESVELACDAQGMLHLMRRDDDGRAVAALTTVAAWAKKHHRLLSMLAPGLSNVGEREPVLHLFTDRPRFVRPLLDADLRIHLLAPVSVEGRSGWYCTELN